MGVWTSHNNQTICSNQLTKPVTIIKPEESFSTKSSSIKDDYLLPETYAKHDDITKYYKISSFFLGKGSSGVVCEAESSTCEKFAIKRINKSSLKPSHNIHK